MFSSAWQYAEDSQDAEAAIPDTPIEFSVPYKSRQTTVHRHFGFFPFFAKKPWQVVQAYIQHYSASGNLVCDPFAGSGVVPVEALVLRRRSVATDINPVARFITRMTAISPVNLVLLREAYEQVRLEAEAKLEELDRMPEPEIVDLLKDLDFPRTPIPTSVRREGAETVDQLHTIRQLAGLTILRDTINQVGDVAAQDLLKVALANTIRYCNRTYSLPVAAEGKNRRSKYTGDANFLRRFSYSFASPERFCELLVWPTFTRAFGNVIEAKAETNKLISEWYTAANFVLSEVPAWRIHEVTGESTVDYCFTDPPYSNQIHFLDLSVLWAAWLGMELTGEARQNEMLIEPAQGKTREQFEHKFAVTAESIARALKPDRWFTLVYKHRDLSLWHAIVAACEESGLQHVNSVWQHATFRSTRQIESPNINPAGDMYLNFRRMSRRKFERIYGTAKMLDLPTQPTYVNREVERLIVAYLGADIEMITSSVIQQILDSRAFRNYAEDPMGLRDDIQAVLKSDKFTTWQPSTGRVQWIISPEALVEPSLPAVDRARYFAFEFLRDRGTATQGEVNQHVLTRLAEAPTQRMGTIDIVGLLRSVAREVERHLWRLDGDKVGEYKQLRLLFEPSAADELRSRIEQRIKPESGPPLRLDLEGFGLLRDRLRDANTSNPDYDGQYSRILDVLSTVLARIRTRLGDSVERVLGVGDWARFGIDLRDLPLEEIVLQIVLRAEERPLALYHKVAQEVFGSLQDDDIHIQFQLQTVVEWERAVAISRRLGNEDALGLSLLVRVW